MELHQEQTGQFVSVVYRECEQISTWSPAAPAAEHSTATQSGWKLRATNFPSSRLDPTTFAQICISVSPQLFCRPVLKTNPAKDALEGICLQAKTLTIGETCCSWLRAVRGFVLQTPYNTILKHTYHQMSQIRPSGLSQTGMELVTNVSADTKILESGIYRYTYSSTLYTQGVSVSD